jgi:2-polyprenyl-3-methyl-5-hydroxy-6-metoxy-1,4-benzoquinol methylase
MLQRSPKWEAINKRYVQRREKGMPGWTDDYTETEKELQDFLNRNGLAPSGKFLELGCGAGNRTLVAARMGFEAYGVDMAEEGISWASARAEEAGVEVDFRRGDIAVLDGYASGFFDILYDGGVLYMMTGDGSERIRDSEAGKDRTAGSGEAFSPWRDVGRCPRR